MDVTAPGRELHARFVALGDMGGMTLSQIVVAVGNPSGISAAAHGNTLIQWMATGYHMAILFGPDEKFISITHQFGNFQAPPSGLATVIWVVVIIVFVLSMILAHVQ
jgi:hypothetical protein